MSKIKFPAVLKTWQGRLCIVAGIPVIIILGGYTLYFIGNGLWGDSTETFSVGTAFALGLFAIIILALAVGFIILIGILIYLLVTWIRTGRLPVD